jgi:serine O-acetyltransferase
MAENVEPAFRRDLARWTRRSGPTPALVAIKLVLANPGLQAVLLLRAQLHLQSAGNRRLAQAMSLLNLRLTGAEFVPGCQVGPGFVARHPQGIVIGAGATVGSDCTFLHHVTLGERYGDGSNPDHEYPNVGNRVVIGVGAVILGGVRVADDAVIGANAVVIRDVAQAEVATGVPAKSSQKRRS